MCIRDSCTCWLIITAVIIDVWLLGLHAEKSASSIIVQTEGRWHVIYTRGLNCVTVGIDQGWFVVIVVDGDGYHRWSITIVVWWRGPKMVCCCRSCTVLISLNRKAPGWLRASELPSRSVLETKSSFWSVSGVAEAFECLDTWHHPMRARVWLLQIWNLRLFLVEKYFSYISKRFFTQK